MPLDRVVYNVLIHLVNVPAMLVTKVPSVMLLVVVIPLDQVVQHVMHQQVNVLVILAIQVPHAILATQITIEQVAELVQVSIYYLYLFLVEINREMHINTFSACGCDATGSSSLQCADSTGQCTCNAGYKGTKCDATCGCDPTGSDGTACDASTGQCTCKNGFTGTTCTTVTSKILPIIFQG